MKLPASLVVTRLPKTTVRQNAHLPLMIFSLQINRFSILIITLIIKKRVTYTTYMMLRSCLILILASLTFIQNSNGQSISGSSTVCVGASTTLSGTPAGGTWFSSNITVATADSTTGIITGISAGVATITYQSPSAIISKDITVNPLPVAGTLVGDSILCSGDTIMLYDITFKGTLGDPISQFFGIARIFFIGTDTMPGHTDISMNIVALSPGVDTISLKVSNSCGNAYATKSLTVYSTNITHITGIDSVCVGQTDTLKASMPGGVWGVQSGFLPLSPTGVVLALLAGNYDITYIVNNLCGIDTAAFTLRVLDSASCSKAGIASIASPQFDLTISPNPSGGNFTISNTNFGSANSHITITDMIGKKVFEMDTGFHADVEIRSGLPPGVYYVTATDGSLRCVRKLIIVQ